MAKWEIFLDESYFGKWCIRKTDELAFTDGIHVVTKEEAEFLVEQLNLVESQTKFIKMLQRALNKCKDSLKDPKYITDTIWMNNLIYHETMLDYIEEILSRNINQLDLFEK